MDMEKVSKVTQPFLNDMFKSNSANPFQMALGSWIIIFCFWIFIAFVTVIHCITYSYWISDSLVDWFEAAQWATMRWLPWIVMTPIIFRACINLQQLNWEPQLVAKTMLKLTLTWGVGIALAMASGEIYLYPTNEIAISFYHKLMKEIPLTMLLIIAVTFGWRYLSHLYTANEQLRSEFVLVDTRDGKQKIDISTLMLISASGNYVNLVTNTGESYLYRSTMKNMHELLDANQFIRIHRSYIINRKGIKRIASGNHGELKLTLNNGQKSVVSRHYAKQLRKEFNNAIESALLH